MQRQQIGIAANDRVGSAIQRDFCGSSVSGLTCARFGFALLMPWIHLIDKTEQPPPQFGAVARLPGFARPDSRGGCPHMVRSRKYTDFVLHCFRVAEATAP
jgi:hypothetical protein